MTKSKRRAKETVTKGFKANTDITLLNPGRQDIKERQIQNLPLSLLGQLFGNVTTHKYCFQIHPQILYKKPALQYLISISQVCYPLLYLFAERWVVPEAQQPHSHLITWLITRISLYDIQINNAMRCVEIISSLTSKATAATTQEKIC